MTALVASVQLQGFLGDAQFAVVLALLGQPGQLAFVDVALGALVDPLRGHLGGGKLGHPGLLGRLGHGPGHHRRDAPVHLAGDDVGGRQLFVGNHAGQGPGRGQVHGDVDPVGPHVQAAPEKARGHQGGPDLVLAVGLAGGHHPGAPGLGFGFADFRLRQGQGEDNGVWGHGGHHLLG